MERPDISRLSKNRSIYMKIGFIVALSMTIMAFNYTTFEKPLTMAPEVIEGDWDDIPIVRTPPELKKPLPPPPKLEALDNIIKDDPDFIEEPIPEPEPIEPIVKTLPGEPKLPTKPIPLPEPEPAKAPIVLPDVEDKEAEIFFIVEEMPRFPGCEDGGLGKEEKKLCADQRMMKFIYSNIKYPAMARETSIEGTVVISFVIEKDGSIANTKILKDIGGGCGQESLRVIKKMPDWIPGRQLNRNVRVEYKLPVKFRLSH